MNRSSNSSNLWRAFTSAQNIVVSSAYWDKIIKLFNFNFSFSITCIPLIVLEDRIAEDNNSTTMMKSKPDRGQPCLTPRFSSNASEANPLFIVQLEVSLYRTLTHAQKSFPKLNVSNALCKKSHSRLSKAFSKSMNKAMPPIFLSAV